MFEVIRRYLRYRGYKVEFVRNITDIDDKIINRAGELNIDWKKLVDKYINNYYKDLESLDIEKADKEPRATENIKDMVKYIKALIDKGYAYVALNGVYFSVRKFEDYGKLSGQSIDQMQDAARIERDEAKADSLDFALWKKAKEGEPSWPSPWGEGRPGWHIECSVMSRKFLKADTLDIHGGGRDLIFPHHENERAQAKALTGKPFANYWIHHGLLTINSQKMAKSSGNFVTIRDAVSRYSADILKIFYLKAHYSSSIDFSGIRMEEAKSAYERIYIFMNRIRSVSEAQAAKKTTRLSTRFRNEFIEAMDDDFNTSRGLAVLFDIINAGNKVLEDNGSNISELAGIQSLVEEILNVFSISFKALGIAVISEKDIEKMIEVRSGLKQQKRYQEADELRRELEKKGIILEDTKEGTLWRKKI